MISYIFSIVIQTIIIISSGSNILFVLLFQVHRGWFWHLRFTNKEASCMGRWTWNVNGFTHSSVSHVLIECLSLQIGAACTVKQTLDLYMQLVWLNKSCFSSIVTHNISLTPLSRTIDFLFLLLSYSFT